MDSVTAAVLRPTTVVVADGLAFVETESERSAVWWRGSWIPGVLGVDAARHAWLGVTTLPSFEAPGWVEFLQRRHVGAHVVSVSGGLVQLHSRSTGALVAEVDASPGPVSLRGQCEDGRGHTWVRIVVTNGPGILADVDDAAVVTVPLEEPDTASPMTCLRAGGVGFVSAGWTVFRRYDGVWQSWPLDVPSGLELTEIPEMTSTTLYLVGSESAAAVDLTPTWTGTWPPSAPVFDVTAVPDRCPERA